MTHIHVLQSAAWAAFQTSVGHTAVTIGDGYAYTHRIGPFRYAYIPRAEVIDDTALDMLAQSFDWVRVEGLVHTDRPSIPTRARQPQTTLVLDLTLPADTLLEQMHSKTRYNIRLAERKGVRVTREKNVDIFWQLNTETTDRDGFRGHDKAYYTQFLSMDMVEQFTAYYEDIPIASIVTVLYDGTMTYVHGASANTHRNLMAPYLLQWTAIEYAQASGARAYDFWGIAPIYPPGEAPKETCYHGYCWELTHPWTGITRFKVGFGGHVVSYPQAQDVIFRPLKYRLYQWVYHWRYGKKT